LGPIFQSRAYGARIYVTSEPQFAEHVLRRNWQNYRKGRAIKRIRLLLGNGLMVSEGDLWKRQRRMIQPAFHEKAITRLTDLIIEGNDVLLSRWLDAAERRQSVNITRDISLMILDIIMKAIFGRDYEQVLPHFSIVSQESERNLHFAQDFRALGQLISELARQRRRDDDESSDMLGLLLRARDRDTGAAMPDNQLVDEVLTLVVAGHETTASTLNWAWYVLSQNPEAAEKLHSEACGVSDLRQLTYARQIIEEIMRLYPAGWLMTRQAIRDDMLGDYYVAAKTEIYISPYVIQRRPDLWTDPDRFDPDRFAMPAAAERLAFLPFSAGPRNCIGEHLARWEMLIHLWTIARRLRLCYLGDQPQYDLGVNLRSKQDFIMQPTIIG
jgi:cytochrome P450